MRFNWRHQYDEEADEFYGELAKTENDGETLTQQHHAFEADINNIVASFGIKDGAVPPVALDPKYFGDFTDAPDFRQALDNTREAQARFDALPASLRNRFNNDPYQLWQFVMDPAQTDEAVKLGLLHREAEVPPKTPDTPGVT